KGASRILISTLGKHMNWLSNWIHGFAVTSRDRKGASPPTKRMRLERVRHFLKVKRARAKSVWRKVPRRVRRILLGASVLTLLAIVCTLWFGAGQKARATV